MLCLRHSRVLTSPLLWDGAGSVDTIVTMQSQIDELEQENRQLQKRLEEAQSVVKESTSSLQTGMGQKDATILRLQKCLVDTQEAAELKMQDVKAKMTAYVQFLEEEHKQDMLRLRESLRSDALSAPTGHIALVFTDVEGSTQLWSDCTSSMVDALRVHNECLRSTAKECNLYEVKSEGDGMFFSGFTVTDATRFCLLAQQRLLNCKWPADILAHPKTREVKHPTSKTVLFRGLRVRMGVHCGDPEACVTFPLAVSSPPPLLSSGVTVFRAGWWWTCP